MTFTILILISSPCSSKPIMERTIDNYITGRYELFLKDLEQVVNMDSGSEYAPGVTRVIEFFEQRFAALKWRTQIHRFAEEVGPCLEVSNCTPKLLLQDSEPEGSGYTVGEETYDLLCVGHADTVFGADTVKDRPFIMVTAESEKSRVVEAREAEASHYIIKPFTLETLREQLLSIFTKLGIASPQPL